MHSGKPYVRVAQGDETYILAKERLSILEGDYEVIGEMDGRDLVDLTYEPLFTDMLPDGLAFVVLDAPELVTHGRGHRDRAHRCRIWRRRPRALPAQRVIAIRHVVGLDGRFLDGQTRYRGLFVKDADPKIIEDLQRAGRPVSR